MKYFIARFLASLSSVKYYQLVLVEKFGTTLKFYLAFLFVISLMLTAKFWLLDLPRLKSETSKIRQEMVTYYPKDLVMNWNGTELHSNQNLTLPFPAKTPVSVKEMANNLAFVDTDEELDSYSTLLALTPTRLLYLDNAEIIEEQELSKLILYEPFEITAQNFPGLSQKIQDWLFTTYQITGFFLPVVHYIYLLFGRAYLIALESGIIFLFFRISKINSKYSKLLQLVIALFVPAEIVNFAANIAGWQLPTSILSLSFWIFFVFVFFSMKKQSKL